LAAAVTKTDSFSVLENPVAEQNLLFRRKGDDENAIREIGSVETALDELNRELAAIDAELLSDAFANR
jgi:hypothetical protein